MDHIHRAAFPRDKKTGALRRPSWLWSDPGRSVSRLLPGLPPSLELFLGLQLFPLHLGQGLVAERQASSAGILELGIEFLVTEVETTNLGIGMDELLDVVTLLVFEHIDLLAVGSVRGADRS